MSVVESKSAGSQASWSLNPVELPARCFFLGLLIGFFEQLCGDRFGPLAPHSTSAVVNCRTHQLLPYNSTYPVPQPFVVFVCDHLQRLCIRSSPDVQFEYAFPPSSTAF